MWLFAPIGFFGAVRKPDEQVLTIRARAPGDLENLRDTYMPELTETYTALAGVEPNSATDFGGKSRLP